MGISLAMNRVPVDVHARIPRLTKLHRPDLSPRFEATFDGIRGIAVRLAQGPARRHAPRNGRHQRRENAVLVLEVIDLEVLVCLHHLKIARLRARGKTHSRYTLGTCGRWSKCLSRLHRCSPCWTTSAAIQMSLVGMGVPCSRS